MIAVSHVAINAGRGPIERRAASHTKGTVAQPAMSGTSRSAYSFTPNTITEYRNRSRVRAVLNDMQEGERHLGHLAARYDFADQSHLVRVMRRYLGAAPAEIRRQLSIDVQEIGHPAPV